MNLPKDDILKIIEKLENSKLKEGGHGYGEFGNKKIKEIIQGSIGDYADSNIPVAVTLIDVVLAARSNYEKIVMPRMKKIKAMDIPVKESLLWLENTISSFENFYNLCKVNSLNRYNTLLGLINAYKILKPKNSNMTEYEVFHNRAINTDINKKNEDLIGKIPRIGIATFQHLRMNFGANTVKPDQRVCEVLEREFGQKKVSQKDAIKIVEEISYITGIDTLYLDQLFVKYGSSYYNELSK